VTTTAIDEMPVELTAEEKPDPKAKLFLCYGRRDVQQLADKLFRD